VSARALAARLGVPGELLSKVLQRLQRAGLVAAVRGSRGGYRLQRPLSDISLREVIEASHGPLAVVDCLKRGVCPQETHCSIRPQTRGLQDLLDGFLGSLSVLQFAAQAGGGA
jgi:Rrf2 family protein